MSTFVLIPGAGGAAWYWHRVLPRIREAGHVAIAVDLPGDDETAGLPEYTRQVLDAIGDREEIVLVGQLLGAFTVPLVAAEVPVRALVLVNGMIPLPGETLRVRGGTTRDRYGRARARLIGRVTEPSSTWLSTSSMTFRRRSPRPVSRISDLR